MTTHYKDSNKFPPILATTNRDRATWAAYAMDTFEKETGISGDDVQDTLSDLLADLMHWAEFSAYDFDTELERARWHFQAELADETVDMLSWPGPGATPYNKA